MTMKVFSDYSRIIVDPLNRAYTAFPYVTAVSAVAICSFAKSYFFPSQMKLSRKSIDILKHIYKIFPKVKHTGELVLYSDTEALARVTHKIIFSTINNQDGCLPAKSFSYNTREEIRKIDSYNLGSEEEQEAREAFSESILQNRFSDERINLCWKLADAGYKPVGRIPARFHLFNFFQMGLAHKNYPICKGNASIGRSIVDVVIVLYYAFFTFAQIILLVNSYKKSCEDDEREPFLLVNGSILIALIVTAVAGWYFPLLAIDRNSISKAMTKVTLFPHFVSAITAANITTIVLSMFLAVDRIPKASRLILLAGYVGAYGKLWSRCVHAIQKNTF